MKHITTSEYRKQTLDLRRKLKKAIRWHKKRSHIRAALQEVFERWAAKFGMSVLGFVVWRTAHKRRNKMLAAVSNNNALLEKLRQKGSIGFVSGGRTIIEEVKR